MRLSLMNAWTNRLRRALQLTHMAGMARLADDLAGLPPSDAQLMAQMALAFARRRAESRGAHIRADYPAEDPAWARSQVARLKGGDVAFEPTVL